MYLVKKNKTTNLIYVKRKFKLAERLIAPKSSKNFFYY